jgi:hypothetical protein
MRICIITDVPIDVKHGMGRYIHNLLEIFDINKKNVFSVYELNRYLINKINRDFDIASIQIGILNTTEVPECLKLLKKINIKKVATIHSVVDKEVDYYIECMRDYFNKKDTDYDIQALYGDTYKKYFVDTMDGFIFYTNNDKRIFNQYYVSNIPQAVIPPSIEYCNKRYSNHIKKNKNLSFLARVDYRKGIVASFNTMEFLTDYELDIYGLISNKSDEVILDYFLNKNKNMSYKGLLQNKEKYFNQYSIFLGNSLYEPFGFSHMENLFNYVVPIIGKNTGTHEIFGNDYSFAISDNVFELKNMIEVINSMSNYNLKSILDETINKIEYLTHSYFKEHYINFLKNV